MFNVGFLAAHEYGDAVMRARDHKLVAQGTQPRRAPSAETIGQHHRFDVCPAVHGVQIFLQRGPE